jgi:hypothetical protein
VENAIYTVGKYVTMQAIERIYFSPCKRNFTRPMHAFRLYDNLKANCEVPRTRLLSYLLKETGLAKPNGRAAYKHYVYEEFIIK